VSVAVARRRHSAPPRSIPVKREAGVPPPGRAIASGAANWASERAVIGTGVTDRRRDRSILGDRDVDGNEETTERANDEEATTVVAIRLD